MSLGEWAIAELHRYKSWRFPSNVYLSWHQAIHINQLLDTEEEGKGLTMTEAHSVLLV